MLGTEVKRSNTRVKHRLRHTHQQPITTWHDLIRIQSPFYSHPGWDLDQETPRKTRINLWISSLFGGQVLAPRISFSQLSHAGQDSSCPLGFLMFHSWEGTTTLPENRNRLWHQHSAPAYQQRLLTMRFPTSFLETRASNSNFPDT